LYERVIAEGECLIAEPVVRFEAYMSEAKSGSRAFWVSPKMVYTVGELEAKISEAKSRVEMHGLSVLEEKGTIYFAAKAGCLGCSGEFGECFEKYFEREGASALEGKDIVLFEPGRSSGLDYAIDRAVKLKHEKLSYEFPKVWECEGCEQTIALLMVRFKYGLGAKSVTCISKGSDFSIAGKI